MPEKIQTLHQRIEAIRGTYPDPNVLHDILADIVTAVEGAPAPEPKPKKAKPAKPAK